MELSKKKFNHDINRSLLTGPKRCLTGMFPSASVTTGVAGIAVAGIAVARLFTTVIVGTWKEIIYQTTS